MDCCSASAEPVLPIGGKNAVGLAGTPSLFYPMHSDFVVPPRTFLVNLLQRHVAQLEAGERRLRLHVW